MKSAGFRPLASTVGLAFCPQGSLMCQYKAKAGEALRSEAAISRGFAHASVAIAARAEFHSGIPGVSGWLLPLFLPRFAISSRSSLVGCRNVLFLHVLQALSTYTSCRMLLTGLSASCSGISPISMLSCSTSRGPACGLCFSLPLLLVQLGLCSSRGVCSATRFPGCGMV